MNRIIPAILVILVLIGGFWAYSSSKNKTTKPADMAQNTGVPSAWIEVLNPKVSQVDSLGKVIREFKTGDEVSAGEIISLGDTAGASVHFGDGSILRMDGGTKIVLDEAIFEPKNEKLSVKVTLVVGRVWSKIIALVSPDSAWQVKTSSAVATVRGTAFGMEYRSGKTKILASQHAIKVAMIDPKTKELKEEISVEVKESSFIEIKDSEVEKIIAKPEALAVSVQVAPKEVLAEAWVKGNVEDDKQVEVKIEELKKIEGSDDKVREKLRDRAKEEFRKVKEENNKRKTTEDNDESGRVIKKDSKEEMPEREVKASVSPDKDKNVKADSSLVKPTSLIISTNANLADVAEGTRTPFQAIAIFENGTRRDVTKEVNWNVNGRIGEIDKSGVFKAIFDRADSETETAKGTVTAIWIKGDNILKSKSVEVNIIHSVPDEKGEEGVFRPGSF